jgi:Predicted membrane protein
MMIFFWILLIIALFYIFGDPKKYINTQRQGTSAEEELKMRYVKGEINEETFEKMKKTII